MITKRKTVSKIPARPDERTAFHVLPSFRPGKWDVRVRGARRVGKRFNRRAAAVAYAKARALRSIVGTLYIHGADGLVTSMETFVREPDVPYGKS
jgi:hypothetical protein